MRTQNCTTSCNLVLLYSAHIIMQFMGLVLQGHIVGDCLIMKSVCANISKPKVRNRFQSHSVDWLQRVSYSLRNELFLRLCVEVTG
jgi:hypothetical protein